jgi:MoaA/NifB/PqqE/SkfB family radical SAM enzyme
VELLTNGTLLTETMISGILDAGLTRLWISIDDLETDSSINASSDGGTLDHSGHNHSGLVLSNIRMLNKIRQKSLSSISLGITFVAMKSNVHQLAKLPTVRLPFFDMNIPEAAEGIRNLMRKQNFNLYFNDQPVLRKTGYCKFVREGMTFVRADGKVCPCMALLHNGYTYLHDIRRKITHCSFGNIKAQPLAEIWNSREYKVFRRKFDEFEFASCLYCGHCELFEENQEDCIGNTHPACGGCLWAEGVLSCP